MLLSEVSVGMKIFFRFFSLMTNMRKRKIPRSYRECQQEELFQKNVCYKREIRKLLRP